MKKAVMLIAACLALPSAAALAQTTVQQYQFPSAPGSVSPPSTLRITTEGGPAAPGVSAGIVHDTPDSLAAYQRCRTVSDRAAITNADRQNGLAQCMRELEARRQQGAVTQ